MLCVTSNDIPGWEIQRVCGEVFGVTVRSRNAFSQMGAGFKSMVGGELQGMTRNVTESRNEAMTRLFAEAQARGGNAIVAMRFDTTELGGNWSEICAYGTAVVAIPVTDEAKQTAIQLGYGRPGAAQQGPGASPQGGSSPQGAPAGAFVQHQAGPPSQPSPYGASQQQAGAFQQGTPAPGAQPWGQTQYSQPYPSGENDKA
jgi:uncharacterized protein YbjQ (UPF0145 family)